MSGEDKKVETPKEVKAEAPKADAAAPAAEKKPAGEKKAPIKLHFLEDFMLAGTAAGVSKTAAAPIEVQNLILLQIEMFCANWAMPKRRFDKSPPILTPSSFRSASSSSSRTRVRCSSLVVSKSPTRASLTALRASSLRRVRFAKLTPSFHLPLGSLEFHVAG